MSLDDWIWLALVAVISGTQWWAIDEVDRAWEIVEESRSRHVPLPEDLPDCRVVLGDVWCIHVDEGSGKVTAWQPEKRRDTP